MPIYDFKCSHCGQIQQDVILSIMHDVKDRPMCCGFRTQSYITTPPMVYWVDPVIDAFRSVADKNKTVIKNTRDRREYMKRHNLIDGNDFEKPPSKVEQMEYHNDVVLPSIDQATPTDTQLREMKNAGITTPIDQLKGI